MKENKIKWEVGKKVRYRSSYSGKYRVSRIIENLGDGKWRLNGETIAYENNQNFTLLQD